MNEIQSILQKNEFSRDDIITLLSVDSQEDTDLILNKALEVKTKTVGRKVYLRGLIELTNKCRKNCFYCGIRSGNEHAVRYELTEDEAVQSAIFSWRHGFGSIVIQSGELIGGNFVNNLENLLKRIHRETNHELTITLSCGEHPLEVYQRWFAAGGHRYLLRIESSNRDLYYKIHPKDENHSFEKRLQALKDLRLAGFQVGTGVMIGLPEQTIENLADDLLFYKNYDIDMIGMGPYLEHNETPLYEKRHLLWTEDKRFQKSLLMIAVLRLMMPYVNIAASTALETLNPQGRQKGLLAGANVVMPNVTPLAKKVNYDLYDKKPHLYSDATMATKALNESITSIGETICYNEPGNSKHFEKRTGLS